MRALPLLLLILLAACDHDHIQVTIRPQADGTILRTVRFWRNKDDKPGQVFAPPEELVAAARKLYGKPQPTKDEALVFSGVFKAVPADITFHDWHNRGGYTFWNSRLGSLGIYRERRPGPTDYFERAKRTERTIATWVKIMATVARQELEGEEGLDRLVAFLEGQFLTDLQDFAILLSSEEGPQEVFAGPRTDKDPGPRATSLALVFELMIERGYIRIGDMPAWFENPVGVEIWLRMIARRMGRKLDPALRAKLAFLADEERVDAVFRQAGQALHLEESRLAEDTQALFAEFSGAAIGGSMRIAFDLDLQPGAELLKGSSGKRSMQQWIEARPVRTVFFAAWSVPDKGYQTRHFGTTLLKGEALGEYVTWIKSLPVKRAAAFEAEVEKLTPGPDLKARLKAIRTTPREAGEPEKGVRILLDALGLDGG